MLVIENCNSLSDLRQKLIDGEEVKTVRQEPCEDAISRQAVIDALTKTSGIRGDALKALYDLPPVNPQPKTGHWINIDATHSKCDRCEAVFEIVSENGEVNYCPNCGVGMVEPQERSSKT